MTMVNLAAMMSFGGGDGGRDGIVYSICISLFI